MTLALRPIPRPLTRWFGGALAAALLASTQSLPAQQVAPGTNVNMVSGTTYPDGDPYLQRQNEPASGVSTRNPLHILAGANDYRTVDLPGPLDPLRGEKMNADAWVGSFKSLDGGQTWRSTLVPGYPQDTSPEGLASPLHGRQAATDPIVRSGTSGLFYYAGLAFDRGANAPSRIFVARFMDLNDLEAGDPIAYLDTRIVDSDTGTRFLDKTAMATDIPRTAARCALNVPAGDGTSVPQNIPAGNVYVAYTAFTGSGETEQSVVLFSRSTNCGASWSAPRALSTGSKLVQNAQIAVSPTDGAVYVSWRRFRSGTQEDAVFVVRSGDGGATFGKPVRVAGLRPFDQPTTPTSFRTNAFQTMAIDGTGRIYMAWSERGWATLRPDPATGDARIVVSTSTNGATWTIPRAVQPGGIGHQLMPVLTFHAGRLRLLYYDLREDVSQLFGPFVDEAPILNGAPPRIRHTADVFVAQALPAAAPVFTTARLSDYAFGFTGDSDVPQRLQYNPTNLPLFRLGTTPFMGDYIDMAPAPPFVQNPNGTWSHNTAASTNAMSHAFWTDNRDVRAPANGDWATYTPVTSDAVGTMSRFDPTKEVPACVPGQTGMRNQNIYTARVSDGLFLSSPGNAKPLGSLQRAFVVLAENPGDQPRSYRFTIANQPPGGQASFLQFSLLTTLDVTVPAFSSVARTAFVTASDEHAQVSIGLAEIPAPGGAPIPGGLAGTVVLNPDPDNPRIQNPRLQNPRLQNPLIVEAEAYNPGITNAVLAAPRIQNPRLQNPSIENPRLQNDALANPRLQNDAVANPGIVNAGTENAGEPNAGIANPRLQNPRLQNADLTNAGFSDTSWVITNDGNTTSAYTVNLVLNGALPAGFASQLLIHKTFMTPTAADCRLAEQPHTILIANVPDPEFVAASDVANPRLQNPRIQNPTLALAPGESATVTLRIVDPDRFDAVTFDASAAVTPAAVAQSVNTVDVANGLTQPRVALPLTITTAALAPAAPGAPYAATLSTFAASGPVSWSVAQGTMPPGLTLNPDGTITGTPTTPGNYGFVVRSADATGNTDDQTLSLQVDPTVPAGFDRVWNGADADWSNPANWSPHGVPGTTDRVYISASIPVRPTLTRNVAVRDLFVEPGATLDTNGFVLTVSHNVDAGRTIVGPGTTLLTGDGGTVAGVFSNLSIQGRITLTGPVATTGSLTLGPGARLELNGQSLLAGGPLVTNVTDGHFPVVSGPTGMFMTVGANVNGLVIQRAPLTIDGGSLARFDNVSFVDLPPESTPLTINHPGADTEFNLHGIVFSTVPTTGRYIQAVDTQADARVLTVNLRDAIPADGSSATAIAGGAVVQWLSDPAAANLAVLQTVSPVPAPSGAAVTIAILVLNGGPAMATGVTLRPGVPAGATGVSVVPSQGSCATGPVGWSCDLGALAPGARATAAVSFVPAAVGTFVASATVSATQPDPVPGNNTHSLGASVVSAAAGVSLSLTQHDSADPVAIGSPFTYALVATNSGAAPADNVLVVDPIPAGVTITNAATSQGACSIAAGQVLCSLGTLAPGGQVTITLSASASVSGLITNTSAVTSSGIELTPADNVATEQTLVLSSAACSVPTFSGPVKYAATAGPVAVVKLVDMNHDGHLDAVASHEAQGGGVDVFLNDGTGRFLAPRFTATPTAPWLHVVADFNGDGHPDVVIATDGVSGNPPTLRMLTGDGTGTLALVAGFSIPFGGWLEALDVDLDGDQDLLSLAPAGDVVLYRNDGSGNFAAVTVFVGAGGGFTSGDFNGDGRPDLAVNLLAAGYAVLLADAGGGFLPPVVHAETLPEEAFGTAADINEDGRTDLLVSGFDGGGGVRTRILFGDGAGGFAAPVDLDGNDSLFWLSAIDANGDGHKDLVGNSLLNAVAVRLGDGTGVFSPAVLYPNAIYYNPAVADVDGDGRPDIVVGDRAGALNVFVNNCGAAPSNLRVTIDESADPVNEGEELAYLVTVTNLTGIDASGIRLTSVLSTGAESEPRVDVLATTSSASGTASVAGHTYTWSLPALAAHGTATFELRLRPLTGGTMDFGAGVTSDGADIDPSDNTAIASTAVNAVGRTIEVTSTNDSGPGSLRQAIDDSNADAGDVDRIVFNIQPGGLRTISPLSPLPTVAQPAIIDGTTQPGYSGSPLIELNGATAGFGSGLAVTAGGSTLAGLIVNRFSGPGISISGGGANTIAGSYIGTNAAGSAALPNGNTGITISNSSGNIIGGTAGLSANVVSGNSGTGILITGAASSGNQVVGNRVGTNAGGTARIPNTNAGVQIISGGGNTIGGPTPAHRNVISGGAINGVSLRSGAGGNFVEGNYIGTNLSGTAALANGSAGIFVGESSANTIINNVVSGNGSSGIVITATQAAPGVASGNLLVGNLIGLNAAGTAAIPNNGGISVSQGAAGTIIGGSYAGARNVISGNAGVGVNLQATTSGTVVRGNYIGTDATGTLSRPNAMHGIQINSSSNQIGGIGAGAGNVLSGNQGSGVAVFSGTNNLIQGNLVGTDPTGTLAVPNLAGQSGIFILGASNNTVGGAAAGAGNLVSGNAAHAITVVGAAAVGNVIQGNLVGTDITGANRLANAGIGIDIVSATNTQIGGAGAARNIISGNGTGIQIRTGATDTLVQNNYIGVNAAGTAAITNSGLGININDAANGNTIGGPAAGLGNVISGNQGGGIFLADTVTSTAIEGNLIGTNAAGTAAIGNGNSQGITIFGPGNRVGGPSASQRNVISGNSSNGIGLGPAGANNVIQGNYVGTDASGTAAVPNTFGGIVSQGGSNNTIEGNLVSGNGQSGVTLYQGATGNVVRDNLVGTNAAGTSGVGNGHNGLFIDSAGNTIGGLTAGDRNVISGNLLSGIQLNTNANGTLVRGNYIGLNVSGTGAIGNSTEGVLIHGTGNVVGGVEAGAGNVIAGNANSGVMISNFAGPASGNRVEGNLIGTNAAGTAALPNGQGVIIRGGSTNTVGGSTVAARNVISGNRGDGVDLFDDATSNAVAGNYIGTNAAGTAVLGNGSHGILVYGAPGNTIGGTTAGAGNVISGNLYGMSVHLAAGTLIQGNRFGLNAAGTAALGNTTHGLNVNTNATDTIVGGSAAGAGNEFSGNQNGIVLNNGSTRTQVLGNRIGTNAAGTVLIPNNSVGIAIVSSSDNTIGGVAAGAGNVIAGHPFSAVTVEAATGNRITGNSIYGNGYPGIDLVPFGFTPNDPGDTDTGANNLQNFPVLTLASSGVIAAALDSAPGTTFDLHFYATGGACDASGYGQGASYLGTAAVTTNASGTGSVTFVVPPAARGGSVTATATDPAGNTSEFSACIEVPGAPGVTPITLAQFSGTERIETFSPNFGRQNSPVTFNGVTYTSLAGGQLWSDINWSNNGYYSIWPNASGTTGLNDLVGQTRLQIEFSTPVNRVGIFASPDSTYTMTAYDDALTAIGSVTVTTPTPNKAAFLGLESPVNVRRIVISEATDNGQVGIFDDLRYEIRQ